MLLLRCKDNKPHSCTFPRLRGGFVFWKNILEKTTKTAVPLLYFIFINETVKGR
jgi:hypothetical protein